MRSRGSAIYDWNQCRRLYGLRWIDGWESKLPDVHLLTGTLVHTGLAHLYTPRPDGAPVTLEAALHAIYEQAQSTTQVQKLSMNQVEIVENAHKLACTMLTAYWQHYVVNFSDSREWATTHVEAPFEIKISERHTLTGTIDRIAQHVNGDLVVWEHKTTSDTRQEYDDAASFRWQTYGYMLGARKILGAWPKYVLYNILGKPTIRGSKKESRDEYYQRCLAEYLAAPTSFFRRVPVRVGKATLQEYMRHMKVVLDEMEDTPRSDYYTNDGNCIRGHGKACQFLETCAAGAPSPNERLFDRTHEVMSV